MVAHIGFFKVCNENFGHFLIVFHEGDLCSAVWESAVNVKVYCCLWRILVMDLPRHWQIVTGSLLPLLAIPDMVYCISLCLWTILVVDLSKRLTGDSWFLCCSMGGMPSIRQWVCLSAGTHCHFCWALPKILPQLWDPLILKQFN